ncbi:MAG TPA: toll/interleukin-1 receptor domain-containing protein [Bradyrhizobium sp.]|jgi:hypothetical protein
MRGKDQVQIFISYARRDDNSTGKAGSLGFVSALREQLGHILEKQGYPEPYIWRDREQIEKGDYFDPVIEKGIESSDLMVVVLSRNWVNRPNCRKELELFQHRWQGMKERVIVVRRNLVDENDEPDLLRGTEGFCFFRFDTKHPEAGDEIYFDRNTATEGEFLDVANELGSYLWRAAKRRRSAGSARVSTVPKASGRMIYLAKPAPDMTSSYEFLANNLENEGITVVPPRDQMIPLDSLALDFIDRAMAQADSSIHLLGNETGYTPSGEQDAIVRMQLARAQARAAVDGNGTGQPKFRQVIWAPKLLGKSESFRDPAAVLKSFGAGIEGYKLLGDGQSSFWITLRQLLNRPEMHQTVEDVQAPASDARIYIYHRKEDGQFADDIATVLRSKDANIVLPAMQGTDVERSQYHKEELRACDTVLLCWARAPDVWARMQLNELRSWQTLGRTNKFRIRGLVLGPPPDESKAPIRLPPKSDYDRLFDFINEDHPNPEALGAVLTGASPALP